LPFIALVQVIKSELLPDEKDTAQKQEMANFDDFQRKKHELNSLLDEIRTVRREIT